jgi:hypothetical protein
MYILQLKIFKKIIIHDNCRQCQYYPTKSQVDQMGEAIQNIDFSDNSYARVNLQR